MPNKEEQLQAIQEQINKIRGQTATITQGVQDLSTTKSTSIPDQGTGEDIPEGGGDVTVPEPNYKDPDLSGARGSKSYLESLVEMEEQRKKEYEAAQEAERKERERVEKERKEQPYYKRMLSGKYDVGTERQKTYEEMGFKPAEFLAESKADIAELDKLNQDYNATVAQRDQQIANIMGRPGIGMNFMNNQIAQINRNAAVVLNQKAANINSKAAIIEAKNNRFNQARDLANEAIQDFMATMNIEYDMYQDFEADNKDLIDSLDQETKDAWAESKLAIERTIAATYKEKEQVGEWMITPEYAGAGILITDDIDTAREKIQRHLASQPTTTGISAPTTKNFGTSDNPDWRQWNSTTGQWEQVSGVTGNIDTREYIQDPNNPNASIPNPNYGQPIGGREQVEELDLTDAQALSLGYGRRMADANETISELGSKFTGLWSYVAGSKYTPNIFKSPDRQRYEQAQRNFVNAVLRKESGAAISPEEFASAAKQYFPQPGDDESVVKQKEQNRLRAIENMAQAAGVPLTEITEGTTQTPEVVPGTIIEYNGKKYKVEADGNLTPQ